MKPPLLSGQKVVKAFLRAGYRIVHQRGSHIKLRDSTGEITIIVPNHPEVDRWTLKGIIADAGMTIPEFLRLID